MPIDSSASRVATSALQAIPFESLIGGPLDAAIKAQAMAAKTTTDFIQAVGFNTDSAGNKSAINIVFQYDRAGKTVNLAVPLLVIVPVPFIAVDLITIDFKANISASASSVQTQETSEERGASASVTARAGGRMWGVSATFNANYSSKKDSKSTQESKYAVEYTMDIHVEAKQDSMPAGLAAVLNILTSAISENPVTNRVSVTVGDTDPATKTRAVTVTVIDANGSKAAGATVTFTLTGTGYTIAPTGPVTADSDGVAKVVITASSSAAPTASLDVSAAAGNTQIGTTQHVDVSIQP